MNESDKIDNLLVKVMLLEATEEERQEVEQWLNNQPENQQYFSQFKQIWQESRKLSIQSQVDENAAWNRFKNRTSNNQRIIEHPGKRKIFWMKIAAIFVAILGTVIILLLNRQDSLEWETLTSTEIARTDTLPDGSIIHLNKHSKLQFTSRFTEGNERTVKLEGEAFFDVAQKASQPFIIEVNNATITVLGTTFNVKSTAENTEVIVETGLVEVKKEDQKIKIAPDEMATIPLNNNPVTKARKPGNLYNYYFTNTLVCTNTPLQQLVNILTEVYHKPIVIENNALLSKEINTVIDMQKDFEENIFIISQTLDITAYTKNDTLFLK